MNLAGTRRHLYVKRCFLRTHTKIGLRSMVRQKRSKSPKDNPRLVFSRYVILSRLDNA